MRWPNATTVVEAIAGKYKSKSCFPFQKGNVQRKIPDLASLATRHEMPGVLLQALKRLFILVRNFTKCEFKKRFHISYFMGKNS